MLSQSFERTDVSYTFAFTKLRIRKPHIKRICFNFSLECFKAHQREHDLREAGIAKRRFQCHVCLKEFTRGTNLTSHLKNNHNVKWPEGLKRFKYVLYEDGFYRLQVGLARCTKMYSRCRLDLKIRGNSLQKDR